MTRDIRGKKVAILTENGFEEVELTSPKKALEEAGVIVQIISPQKEKVIKSKQNHWLKSCAKIHRNNPLPRLHRG